ncbi:hypothetical protein NUU61_005800 [Penicillium alfredii]|uniref:Aspergillopepsin-2 n=1 Tax=Penicillium alfredii TaxID=1506179 RepID=A0A9W9FA76_9EURO|nr:uncharacterized protein NUU61_005800 [Penicillium alfredii]KAJ5096444.1 hypothetical protein NUU61_005800 [Penicillium alfredii]
MKLSSTILTTAMLAGRLEARGVLSRQSLPADKLQKAGEENGVLLKEGSDSPSVQYSKNWAGVVREHPPPSGTYTAVSATFTVPEPTATDDSGDLQAASAWVGIDGDTYTQAILQTGIDCYVQNGTKAYDAWYEWYPETAENFVLELSAGDVIVAKVESSSPDKGVAIIENKSSGKTATKTLSAPSTNATLGGQNVEWIVEDFNAGDSMVPLVNFGKVTFTGAEAKSEDSEFGVNNAQTLDIQQDGEVKADVKIISDSEFSVTYQ